MDPGFRRECGFLKCCSGTERGPFAPASRRDKPQNFCRALHSELEAVIGGDNFDLVAVAADLLVADRLAGHPFDLGVVVAGLQLDKLDRRTEELERHRKIGHRLLAQERLPQILVAAVDADSVARNVRRREEREPHDVVPVHMREKHIEALRAAWAVLAENLIAKLAQPGAEIAYEILVLAGNDLDAAGVAAKGTADREGQVAVDKAVNRLGGGQP